MLNLETALLEYQNKLQGLQASFSSAQAKQSGALVLLAVVLSVVLLLCMAAYSSRRLMPVWLPPLPLPLVALSLRRFFQNRRDALNVSRLSHF